MIQGSEEIVLKPMNSFSPPKITFVSCFTEWASFMNVCCKSVPIIQWEAQDIHLKGYFTMHTIWWAIIQWLIFYFVEGKKTDLDNYRHLVTFYSQICQPLNGSKSTKQYFTCSQATRSMHKISISRSVFMIRMQTVLFSQAFKNYHNTHTHCPPFLYLISKTLQIIGTLLKNF